MNFVQEMGKGALGGLSNRLFLVREVALPFGW